MKNKHPGPEANFGCQATFATLVCGLLVGGGYNFILAMQEGYQNGWYWSLGFFILGGLLAKPAIVLLKEAKKYSNEWKQKYRLWWAEFHNGENNEIQIDDRRNS